MSELYHYGVLGMRWGVRRSVAKSNAQSRLSARAIKYDKKAAAYTKKSEKIHAKEDLQSSNKASVKAAKYAKKSAVLNKKALKTDNNFTRSMLEKKSAKLDYKSAKQELKGNRISKTKGYSAKAMKYSIKSDRMAAKAAKTRMKMANNKAYYEMTKRKINTLSDENIKIAQNYLKDVKF